MLNEPRFIFDYCPTCDRVTHHAYSSFGFWVCFECLASEVQNRVLVEWQRQGGTANNPFLVLSKESYP